MSPAVRSVGYIRAFNRISRHIYQARQETWTVFYNVTEDCEMVAGTNDIAGGGLAYFMSSSDLEYWRTILRGMFTKDVEVMSGPCVKAGAFLMFWSVRACWHGHVRSEVNHPVRRRRMGKP